MKPVSSFATLADRDLLDQAHRLARDERKATAALIACLAEVDARRLYLGEGCSSLFAWCTDVLHLSGDAAYGRIETARVARRYPVVMELLASGSVTMTVVALLGPPRRTRIIASYSRTRITSRSARWSSWSPRWRRSRTSRPRFDGCRRRRRPSPIEDATALRRWPMVCRRRPLPEAARHVTLLRLQPSPRRRFIQPRSSHRGRVIVLSSRRSRRSRYKIQFTAGQATHDKLRRAQDLLRHAVPNGDPAEIFDRALSLLIAQLEAQKWAAAAKPRAESERAPKGRTIPAAVRRAVFRRDDGRCAFVGSRGRCTATAFLEFHHVIPFSLGGAATEGNIQLRCRAHNQHEAEETLGTRGALFVREASVCY